MNLKIYKGSCHCNKVQFEIQAPKNFSAIECNCSVCSKSGYLHLHIKKENFTLISGKNILISYRFNTKEAEHLFCRYCGIKSFYQPRSHKNSYSINVRCLDDIDVNTVKIEFYNGRSWEDNIKNFPDQPSGTPDNFD